MTPLKKARLSGNGRANALLWRSKQYNRGAAHRKQVAAGEFAPLVVHGAPFFSGVIIPN
jgi:hypothetical protein